MTLEKEATNNTSMWGNSFLIFFIRFFPTLATLLVIIGYSRVLPQDVYGQYQSFWVQLYLLSSIALIGVPALLLTYKPTFIKTLLQTLKAKHYLLLASWIIIIAALFAYLCIQKIELDYYIPFAFFLVYATNAIAEVLLIVYRKYSILLFANIAYAVVFVLLHLDVLNGAFSITELFGYLLALGAVRVLITTTKAFAHTKKVEGEIDERYTLADIKSLWFHIGIYDVFQKSITWVDKFVIIRLFSLAVSGVYFNATYDIPFLPLIIGAVSGAALMQMASFKKDSSNEATVYVSHQTGRILSSIAFPLFFFLFLYRQEVFTVIFTEKYAESIPIFAAAVCIVPLRAYSFTSILQNKHKGKLINIGALLDYIVACLLMYPLYQLMGLAGIALSFVLSTYVQSAYYLHHTARLLNTTILKLLPVANWLIKFILFGSLFFIAHYLIDNTQTETFVLISGIVLMVLAIVTTLLVELKMLNKSNGK